MASGKKSKKHHWWPICLQKYWTDKDGDAWWIKPDEKIDHKKPKNEKIDFKIHGHTMHHGTVWETNFEHEFDIDNDVHNIIRALTDLKPLEATPRDLFRMIGLLGKKDRSLRDISKFYHLDEELHRKFLLLIYSLLIRSPRNRYQYESYSQIVDFPPNEEVGKGNMEQTYKIAKKLCREGPISNQFFVLIHSPLNSFTFGDGNLDWLTSGLRSYKITGCTLLPLTPNLCVYFCTPRSMRSTQNVASLSAAPWIVDRINEITQIYSKEKIFFLGKKPNLTSAFQQDQFLEHTHRTEPLIDMLNEIAALRGTKNHG